MICEKREGLPSWLQCDELLQSVHGTTPQQVRAALVAHRPGAREFAALISPAADALMEPVASRATALTRRHFGRTISLYAPLYLSNYCSGGCVYCGFASDRNQPRHRLSQEELEREIEGLKQRGIEDVLLLTGEECAEADFEYLLASVAFTATHFHNVTVEAFAMSEDQYAKLQAAGCTGITLYQETYDVASYEQLHRWGGKRDFLFRLEAPDRALAAGMRTVGVGVLLGLSDPIRDSISLFLHIQKLRKQHWQSGILVSFPRFCHEAGEYQPAFEISDRLFTRLILAFRLCLPDAPLVLSTRERPAFRDRLAGIGISRMSVASRTTVGGYSDTPAEDSGQFDVNDTRDVEPFRKALHERGLEAVFKNWDTVFS